MDLGAVLFTYLFSSLLLLLGAGATRPPCYQFRTKADCTKTTGCHFCTYPSGFCLPSNDACPSPPLPPDLNGPFWSSQSFDVIDLKAFDSSTVSAVNRNDSWDPTNITVAKNNRVSVKLSSEKQPRSGIARVEPHQGTFVEWILPGGEVDLWRNGTLPPPAPGVFPVRFESALFHSLSNQVMTVTWDASLGRYALHSENGTFPDTEATPTGSSGLEEAWTIANYSTTTINDNNNENDGDDGDEPAVSGYLNCEAIPQGSTCASSSVSAEIVFYTHPEQQIWRRGGVPPPPPPPKPYQCSGELNRATCLNATFPRGGDCVWCTSDDGLDALCFSSDHEPPVASWKCEKRDDMKL